MARVQASSPDLSGPARCRAPAASCPGRPIRDRGPPRVLRPVRSENAVRPDAPRPPPAAPAAPAPGRCRRWPAGRAAGPGRSGRRRPRPRPRSGRRGRARSRATCRAPAATTAEPRSTLTVRPLAAPATAFWPYSAPARIAASTRSRVRSEAAQGATRAMPAVTAAAASGTRTAETGWSSPTSQSPQGTPRRPPGRHRAGGVRRRQQGGEREGGAGKGQPGTEDGAS